jgi:hypothetical protein
MVVRILVLRANGLACNPGNGIFHAHAGIFMGKKLGEINANPSGLSTALTMSAALARRAASAPSARAPAHPLQLKFACRRRLNVNPSRCPRRGQHIPARPHFAGAATHRTGSFARRRRVTMTDRRR